MKIIINLLLLLTCTNSIGQEKFRYDRDSFILGLFDDYNGRSTIPTHVKEATRLTSFYCSQQKLSELFLDSLKAYKKEWSTSIKNENGVIYAAKWAAYFNTFYDKKLAKDGVYSDSTDLDYPVYAMRLNKSHFKTAQQKISFLAGTFLRYGKLEQGNITLAFANSASHYNMTVLFIKQLGFKILSTSIISETIPARQTIAFVPSEKYTALFTYLNSIKPTVNKCK